MGPRGSERLRPYTNSLAGNNVEKITNNLNMNEIVKGKNETHANNMEKIANNVDMNQTVEDKKRNPWQ